MSGTLHTPAGYYKSFRVQIAAKYSGFKLQVGPSKSDDGCPLTFESGNKKLFEPTAMAFFVGGKDLNGGDHEAEVIQWCVWADTEILPPMATWVYPTFGLVQFNKAQCEKAKQSIKSALEKLNNHLEDKTFLVGERITLADITVATDLLLLYQHVLEDGAYRKPFAYTTRWFSTVINQPKVKEIVGEVKLCVKEAQFDNKKFQELHKQQGGGKKQAQQQQQQKKETPKKSGGDDDDVPPVKEDKDPFAAIPRGTKFNLDEWKRTFSNNDYDTVAKSYFWQHFDPEHYSLWYCEYKYPEELRLTFMSCNLIGGMFQRLDRMQKHAFANMCIFGENYKSTISGVWLWRGQELAFLLSPDLQVDYESYDWRKLDPTSPQTKKMVDEYFAEKGDFDGKNVCEFKTFK
jgi:elongation factor 1-gamma